MILSSPKIYISNALTRVSMWLFASCCMNMLVEGALFLCRYGMANLTQKHKVTLSIFRSSLSSVYWVLRFKKGPMMNEPSPHCHFWRNMVSCFPGVSAQNKDRSDGAIMGISTVMNKKSASAPHTIKTSWWD